MRVSELLEKTLLALPNAQKIKEQRIIDAWPRVVGEEVAKRTEPLFFEHGLLFVRVTDSVWAQHLSLQRKKIVNLLNRQGRTRILKELRFQSGPVKPLKLIPAAAAEECPWLQIRLTAEEEHVVEEALKQSSLSRELCEAMRSAFLSQKRGQKWLREKGYRECQLCRTLYLPGKSKLACAFCRTAD